MTQRTDRPRKALLLPALALALLAATLWLGTGSEGSLRAAERTMPDFTNQSPQAWVNTMPLRRADLAGKVVLIEIWTSG
jgi:hypothetical protein